jgi:hypothetical protein
MLAFQRKTHEMMCRTRQQAALWIFSETLTLAFATTPMVPFAM